MKAKIHPEYQVTEFHCACGANYTTYSTLGGSHRLDICANCHPFFTGKEKLVDTAGRIEKFNRRYRQKETQAEGQPATQPEPQSTTQPEPQP